MCADGLRVFNRPAILKVRHDAGCAEGVAADGGADAGLLGAAAMALASDHYILREARLIVLQV